TTGVRGNAPGGDLRDQTDLTLVPTHRTRPPKPGARTVGARGARPPPQPTPETRNRRALSASTRRSKPGRTRTATHPQREHPRWGVRGTPRAGSGGCAPRKHDEDRKQRRRPRVEQGGAFGRVEVPGIEPGS